MISLKYNKFPRYDKQPSLYNIINIDIERHNQFLLNQMEVSKKSMKLIQLYGKNHVQLIQREKK